MEENRKNDLSELETQFENLEMKNEKLENDKLKMQEEIEILNKTLHFKTNQLEEKKLIIVELNTKVIFELV
jgi:Ni,Fe-hydrogenase III component G